jgi:hypothetical protein
MGLEEKKFLDGISSPVQKKSIKDIPMPVRHKKGSQIETEIKKTIVIKKIHSKNSAEQELPNKETIGEFVRQQKETIDRDPEEMTDEQHHFEKNNHTNKKTGQKNKWWPMTVIVVIVFALFWWGFSFFSHATISITPKTAELNNLNISLPIIDENLNNKDLLNYKILEIEETANKIIDSESEQMVENKASGIITVYNEFNTGGQRLIQNTRFQSPEGLIYRIKDSITVPGYTERDGQKIAGSIDVEIFADEAGQKYNIGKTEFKIPGFEKQEQYDFFYAKSKTDMAGGFIGTKNTVSEETFQKNLTDLQGEITNNILKKLKETASSNSYVYIYSPDKFEFYGANQNNKDNKKVEIVLTGKSKIYILEKSKIAEKIAEKEIRDYQRGAPILIANIDNLNFVLEEEPVISNDEEIFQNNKIIKISGNPKFIWQNNHEKLRRELAGKNRKSLFETIINYPGISTANATMNFIFNDTFPKNPDKIKIILENY